MRKDRLALFSARGQKSFRPEQIQRLCERFEMSFVAAPSPLPLRDFTQILSDKDFAGITPRCLPRGLKSSTLRKFVDIDTVSLPTTGTEWFPLELFESEGIQVRNLPNYSGQSTAEFAWGLILSLNRHILKANERVLRGTLSPLVGRELFGKTLGIIGCGDVGRRTGQIGLGFGMRVIAHDLNSHSPFENLSLDAVLQESDVISIHLPLNDSTGKIFTESRLRLMRPRAVMVNTARPALIDFSLMEKILNENVLAGYAVDQGYLSRRQMFPLAKHPKVLAVPHISWYTHEAMEREMADWVDALCGLQKSRRPSSNIKCQLELR